MYIYRHVFHRWLVRRSSTSYLWLHPCYRATRTHQWRLAPRWHRRWRGATPRRRWAETQTQCAPPTLLPSLIPCRVKPTETGVLSDISQSTEIEECFSLRCVLKLLCQEQIRAWEGHIQGKWPKKRKNTLTHLYPSPFLSFQWRKQGLDFRKLLFSCEYKYLCLLFWNDYR